MRGLFLRRLEAERSGAEEPEQEPFHRSCKLMRLVHLRLRHIDLPGCPRSAIHREMSSARSKDQRYSRIVSSLLELADHGTAVRVLNQQKLYIRFTM